MSVPAAHSRGAAVVEPRSRRRLERARSPALAAVLSIVPGLGQLYARSLLRGVSFFTAAVVAQQVQAPAALTAFLYVFNLWDAYRCAQVRNTRYADGAADPKEARRDRVDDAAFTLTGLATLAYTFFELGGADHRPIDTFVPLAAVAACLVLAQETRT